MTSCASSSFTLPFAFALEVTSFVCLLDLRLALAALAVAVDAGFDVLTLAAPLARDLSVPVVIDVRAAAAADVLAGGTAVASAR